MERLRRGTRGRADKGDFSTPLRQAADTYQVRILFACCAALLMTIVLLQLPADFIDGRIAIRSGVATDDAFRLDVHRAPAVGEDVPRSILAADLSPLPDNPSQFVHETGAEESNGNERSARERPLSRLESHQVLAVAEDQPRFAGGIGRYYMNIDYPDEAREAGIQGRLVLRFTVDVDGLARDIVVEESLHPLTDSSAVAALKRSHFIPGRVDGERVPMRLRLPVRFHLVESPTEQLLTDSKH